MRLWRLVVAGRPTRRAAVVATAWVAATGLAVAVSWYGLRPVLDAAVPDRAFPVLAEDLRAQSPAAGPPTPAPQSTTSRAPRTGVVTAAPVPPGPAPSRGSGPGSTHGPVQPPPPATPGPTTQVESPPRIVDGWTVVTEIDGIDTYLRTFEAAGGTVAARVRPGIAALVSATPRAGFTFRAQNPGPERLVVQFWTDTQMSTVDVMWFDGAPWFHITEQ